MEKNELDVCKTTIIHEEKVNHVQTELKGKDFADLLVLSKCLGDSSRIKILYALATYKEMCVCDLAAIIDASMASTSHHLRFLKKTVSPYRIKKEKWFITRWPMKKQRRSFARY